MKTMIGRWAFIVAAILALLAGLLPNLQGNSTVMWVLIVLGLVVGFLNVTERESTGFLVASIALIVSLGTLGGVFRQDIIGTTVLKSVFENIIAIASPASVVVAVKHLYTAAQD